MLNFFIIQNYLKINHWQTSSYSQHVAIGNLYDVLTPLMDQFIETLQGQLPERIMFKKVESIDINNQTDKDIKKILQISAKWLQNELPKILLRDESLTMNTDLKNIVDEMLGEINKTLFLLTLS